MIIRTAVASDALKISVVHSKTFYAAYRDLLPESVHAAMSQKSDTRSDGVSFGEDGAQCFVALHKDEIVGFSACGKVEHITLHMPQNAGEIYSLYVLPQMQNNGIGTHLFQRSLSFLQECGYSHGIVRSLRGSGAPGFYEKMGGVLLGGEHITFKGAPVDVVYHVWNFT